MEDITKLWDFDAKATTQKLIEGIRSWFDKTGKDCKAVIGLSGGKDSTICAKLCVEALGKDRVVGIGIPDVGQGLNEADEIAEWLGITFKQVRIDYVTDALHKLIAISGTKMTSLAEMNIPPRVRMVVEYMISQSVNGRVVGTCNASENYIGYFTKYGDGASDFEPLAELTVHELYKIGDELGIPKKWTYKVPDDSLPNSQPDDEKFARMGFSYEKLDKYLKLGTSGDEVADAAIEKIHKQNLFKLNPVEVIKV